MTTATPSASNPTPSLLATFGLQEAPLARALHATKAAIHGGAALSWYLGTPAPPGQDIDIWCQPAEPILRPVIYALYDTIFRAAGYVPKDRQRNPAAAEYYDVAPLHIDAVHNWYNPTLKRKIQLILRTQGPDIPASPVAEFDLDITMIRVAPHPADPATLCLQTQSTELCSRIDRRVMRINCLRGQNLASNLSRVHKYYARGFAFETTESTCSCPCGAATHTAIIPPRRLECVEAIKYVRNAWIAANPLPDNHPLRADVLKATLLSDYNNKSLITKTYAQLMTERDHCRQAVRLPQNLPTYPQETEWLQKYYTVLLGLTHYHRLQRLWGETPNLSTATTKDIAAAIQNAKWLIKSPASDMFQEVYNYAIALFQEADRCVETDRTASTEWGNPAALLIHDVITYV